MSESVLLRRVQVALAALHVRLFRNNVGRLQARDGRYVTYGLCPGSSDLIGWTPVTITHSMVGHTVPLFTAIEVKSPLGRLTSEQSRFLETVRRAGGIGAVVRSEAEAEAILTR